MTENIEGDGASSSEAQPRRPAAITVIGMVMVVPVNRDGVPVLSGFHGHRKPPTGPERTAHREVPEGGASGARHVFPCGWRSR